MKHATDGESELGAGFLPRARTDGIIVEELADEVLVYDVERDRAHCLNGASAAIWKHCDGTRTVSDLRRSISDEGAVLEADVVWLALRQLDRRHLLMEPLPPEIRGIGRRELLRKAAVVGAVGLAIPLVKSIVAPTAARAASCFPSGHPCTQSGTPCCNGPCIPDGPDFCP